MPPQNPGEGEGRTAITETTQIACPYCDGINRVPTLRLVVGSRCGACKTRFSRPGRLNCPRHGSAATFG